MEIKDIHKIQEIAEIEEKRKQSLRRLFGSEC